MIANRGCYSQFIHQPGRRAIDATRVAMKHLDAGHSVLKASISCSNCGWGKVSYAPIRHINRNKAEGLAGWLCLPARIC